MPFQTTRCSLARCSTVPVAIAPAFRLFVFLGTSCVWGVACGWAEHPRVAAPADPHEVLGTQACVKCHASELEVWRKTPHAETFETLHRRPEAREIAERLGIRSIKYEGRCVACHYTQQADPSTGSITAIAGVSCESCHGAAKSWLDAHHDYGGPQITRQTESPSHRQARIDQSVALGMRNPDNVFLVAQSCYRCHTVGDEELVNVGGHHSGSLDFEFVAWSQGMVRHNFVRSDGKANRASPLPRLRVMFVAGLLADLESSLRAVATATEKATYGVTVAKRAARAAARLQSAAAKVDVPLLDTATEVSQGIALRLGNGSELTAAADRLSELGYQFAEQSDGSELAPLDPYLPSPDSWK